MASFYFMGWFSRKKVVSVASVAINMVSDTPNTGKDSVLLSVLTDGDISAELINNYANGIGLKMRNLQQWADSHYYYGLPSAAISTHRTTDLRVRNRIAAEWGIPNVDITVVSNIAGTVDTDGLAHEFMRSQRGWEISNNRVDQPPSGTTGLVQFKSSFIKEGGGILVIQYEDSIGIVEEEVLYPGLTYDDVWYHVSYYMVGTVEALFWNYEVSTNLYPELNMPGSLVQANNPYFPIVPFRVNNVDQAKESNPAYKSTVQLLSKLGMDFSTMSKGIHDNPDISEVDQAFMYIAVPLMSDEMNSIRYLQAHFEDLERISTYKKRNFDIWLASNNNSAPPPMNVIKINDSTFNVELSYSYIDTQVITGDTYRLNEGKRTVNVRSRGSKKYSYTGSSLEQFLAEIYSYERSTITFEIQVAPGIIHKTTVHGLYMVNKIYGKHNVEANIEEAVADKATLLIPVNVNVVNAMGIKDGDLLYYDALWLIFNSYKVTKLKWYQTGIFKIIIMIIAIIITIYSLGSAWETIAAAAAIGASEVAMVVITQILVSYAVKAVVSFAMEKLGLQAAIILAVVATLYGAGGSLNVGGSGLLPFAQQVLTIAQVMLKEVMEDIGGAINDIQDELAELVSTQNDMDKEFERLEKELNGDGGELDFNDVIRLRPNIDLTESPSAFFHRAIHSGNIAIASLDAPRNYVQTMLELPENKSISNFGEQ